MAVDCLTDENIGIANAVKNLEKTNSTFKVNIALKALE